MSPKPAIEVIELTSMPRAVDVLAALGVRGPRESKTPGINDMTLPQLFGLTADEEALLWSLPAGYSLADAGLREDALPCLLGISQFDEAEVLLACTVGHLAAHCPDEVGFRKFLESSANVFSSWLHRDVVISASSRPMLRTRLVFLGAMPIRSVAGAEQHQVVLDALGLSDLGDLIALSEQTAVETTGLTLALLETIDWLQRVGERALRTEQGVLSVHGTGPRETPSVTQFCVAALSSLLMETKRSENKDGRLVRVFVARNGLDTGSPMTLQDCGVELGVTRERVRQLETKIFRVVDKSSLAAALWPLHLAIWCALKEHGGATETDRINEWLSSAWEVPSRPGYLASLTDLFTDVRKSSHTADVLVLDDLACGQCEILLETLDLVAESAEPVSLAELSEMMWANAKPCESCGLECAPSPDLLRDAISRTGLASRGLRLGKAGLYGKGVGVHNPSTRGGQLLGILRRSGGPMHFTEILATANELNPEHKFTKRSVYQSLSGLGEAVSWDTGTFIHIANMPCPYGLVRKAEDWMRLRFKDSDYLPFVSSNGPFREFEDELVTAGVPSALALYSLLRISGEKAFTFPRYPYVCPAKGFEGRSPLAAVMAEFVRRAGTQVSVAEIRDFVVTEMGFKLFQFDQRVYDLPDVLATDDGFIHRDYVRVNEAARRSLLEYAEAIVSREGHVSVERVFRDRRVDCALSGITGPRYLFSIIETAESDLISADRYPVLSRRGSESESGYGIQLLVLQYLRSTARPVSLEELEEEFIAKRHYKRGSVFAVAYRRDVLRYTSASLVHRDALGWNEDKETAFERAAFTLYESALARGELVGRTEDLVEREALPELLGGALWTQQLAADLITKSEQLILIGNARNAYSAKHAGGVESLGNLVGALVRERFGGGVSVTELEKVLRACGALAHNLAPALIADEPTVELVGYEIRLVVPEATSSLTDPAAREN